jgi:hypothetical protein
MVIQAGPPFLLVHTNAAYTRLTGIDAHAAVGKPVSTLLSIQAPGGNCQTSLSVTNADLEGPSGAAIRVSNSSDQTSHYREGIANPQAYAAQQPRLEGLHMHAAGVNLPQGQPHAEAAAAGVARAAQAAQHESPDVCLERLVAAVGFGKYHLLHAICRPHHMVGRNVTFVNKTGTAGATASLPTARMQNDYGSSDTSQTSKYEGPFEALACRASISPILSDTVDSVVVSDSNGDPHGHKNKRRKQQHHNVHEQQLSSEHHHRRPHAVKQCVTHYAIQLEFFDDSKELNWDSLSSTSSVEANLLGLTKAELRRQQEVAQGGANETSQEEAEERRRREEEEEGIASETTEATVPVTAVG